MSRPPLTASRVAAAFAVRTGLRNVELRTMKPMPTRGTIAASAEPSVKQSKAGDVPPQRASTCSPVHNESKPSVSASWATARMRCQARSADQPSNSLKKPWGKIRPIFIWPSVRHLVYVYTSGGHRPAQARVPGALDHQGAADRLVDRVQPVPLIHGVPPRKTAQPVGCRATKGTARAEESGQRDEKPVTSLKAARTAGATSHTVSGIPVG